MLPYAVTSTTYDFPSCSSSAGPSVSAASISKQYATIPCRNNDYRESCKKKKYSVVENQRSVAELELENESLRRENVVLKDENKSLRWQNFALKAKYNQVG